MIDVPPEFLAFLRDEESRAEDSDSDARRAVAIDFYNGEPFGDEEEGRSQLVTRDVAEVVDYMTVSLLRTVVSGERVVEFEGRSQAQDQYSDDATETITQNFMRRQKGYQLVHDWIKAGLIEITGVVKTYAEPQEPKRRVLERVSALALLAVEQQGHKVIEAEETGEHDEQGAPLLNIALLEKQPPRFCDYAVPNEEFRCAPDTRDLDSAVYIAHLPPKTISDLARMGFAAEELESLETSHGLDLSLSAARDGAIDTSADRRGANRRVAYREEHVLYDLNGDGIAERLMVQRVGNDILALEEVEDHPFEEWCPFPMPHRRIGQSLAEKVLDIQRTRSVVLRQTMDGFYFSNAPRTFVNEDSLGESTIEDLLTIRPGSIVRYRGQVPIETQSAFNVGAGLQMLEQMIGERESRTGITRLNQGLDADTLNKMLCVETTIPLANGKFVKLGDVVDGTLIVGRNGKPVRVLRAHQTHFPERAYRIRFASGEVIEAGGEHLWTVQTGNDKRYGKTQTVDTDTLFEMMQGKGAVYIPRVQRPLTGHDTALPLDPYILGLWLGDGNSYAPRITTMEAETADHLAAWSKAHGGDLKADKHQRSGQATSYYVGGLYNPLRELKLVYRGDDRDQDIVGKHIPEAYFTASYEQRLELLRGLMDTDGCHHSNALAIFCQREGRLLDDTVRLIESLGGWPSVNKLGSAGRFQHTSTHYQVTYSLADCPFRLSRKAVNWTPPQANATSQPIKAIERIDIKPMRCLTVDAPDGLFCVGKRFTVTHNTATGTALMQAQGQQIEEYLARNFAEALARLFTKKLKVMKRHGGIQPLRVDGKFRNVDPAQWDEEMDVTIRVGIGSGRKDQRLAYRQQVAEFQKICLQGGLRIVGEQHIYNSLKGIVADMGLGSVNDYAADPGQMPPPDQGGGKPDHDAQKQAAEMQARQADWQQRQQESAARIQLQQQKDSAKIALDQARAQAEAGLARSKAQFEAELAREKAATEYQLAQQKLAHAREMAMLRAVGGAGADPGGGEDMLDDEDVRMAHNRDGGDLSK